MEVLSLLTGKSIWSILRHPSARFFLISSTALVFGSLYFIFYVSDGLYFHFSSSDPYKRLSLDLECKIKTPPESSLYSNCIPIDFGTFQNLSKDESAFLSLLEGVDIFGNGQESTNKAVSKLISMIMNGVPLLDTEDYVTFSTYLAEGIDAHQRRMITDYPIYGDILDNILNLKNKTIILSPQNCWSSLFSDYLNAIVPIREAVDIKIANYSQSLWDTYKWPNVWAVVEFNQEDAARCSLCSASAVDCMDGPVVNIRMLASAVPDTRNYAYKPGYTRLLSGHVLYFLSGFLSLQLDIQNFLSELGFGGTVIKTNVFSTYNGTSIPFSFAAESVAEQIALSYSTDDLYDRLTNRDNDMKYDPVLKVPISYRAFPSKRYLMSVFWHACALLSTTVLVLLFSVPAALTAGNYRQEFYGGQWDILSTLPVVTPLLNGLSWCVCCLVILLPMFAVCWIFFAAVLTMTRPVLPAIALFLSGAALGPLSIILSMLIKRPESLVVDIPIIVFVIMLPGLVYNDLVFDIPRSTSLELSIALLPPSAVALLLRELCYVESIKEPLTINSRLAVSNTPLKYILLMLVADCVLYTIMAVLLLSISSPNFQAGSLWNMCWKRCQRFVQNGRQVWSAVVGGKSQYQYFDEAPSPFLSTYSSASPEHRAHDDVDDLEYTNSETVLTLIHVRKSFTLPTGEKAEVLHDISAELKVGFITCFLGGNGAGKSTLLKLLCGLDTQYEGIVLQHRVSHSVRQYSKRKIGYCPQIDSLFDNLTIRENLELFIKLDQLSYKHDPQDGRQLTEQQVQQEVDSCLCSLDLLQHGHKRVTQLSGGMKRRLSLSLAFVGNPLLILLDEPTTGCDSYTRELVRNDVLQRRSECAIVVSTHHMDDVELLADRVWFLNDKYFTVNSSLRALRSKCIYSPSHPLSLQDFDETNNVLEFSTSNSKVSELFQSHFANECASWRRYEPSSQKNEMWRVPSSYHTKLLAFIESLEDSTPQQQAATESNVDVEVAMSWRLNEPSLGDALVEFMDSQQQQLHCQELFNDFAEGDNHVRNDVNNAGDDSTNSNIGDDSDMNLLKMLSESSISQSMGSVSHIRAVGLRQKWFSLIRSAALLPFLVALIISLGCANLVYPPLVLSSSLLNGIGEVPISIATDPVSTHNSSSPSSSVSHLPAQHETNENCKNFPNSVLQAFDTEFSPESNFRMLCLPSENSNQLFDLLFSQFYAHHHARWAAFVANDTSSNWAETSLSLVVLPDPYSISDVVLDSSTEATPELSLVSHSQRIQFLRGIQKSIGIPISSSSSGSGSSSGRSSSSRSSSGTSSGGGVRVSGSEGEGGIGNGLRPAVHVDSQPQDIYRTVLRAKYALCNSSNNNNGIDNSNYALCNTDIQFASNSSSVLLTSSKSLRSRLTVLNNITVDHVAPIVLKELTAVLYSALFPSYSPFVSPSTSASVSASVAPKYLLLSEPLPLNGFINKTYLERGYLGAIIVVLFMQIVAIASVKYVVRFRQMNSKIQLHLLGVSVLEYWTINALLDMALLLLSYGCIVLAIVVSGRFGAMPIATVFGLQQNNSRPVVLAICLSFIAAIVPSSYLFCFFSTDPLSSQLSLLVCNIVCGLLFRFVLDAHPIPLLLRLSRFWICLSPTFAFTTAMFDIFSLNIAQELRSLSTDSNNRNHLIEAVYVSLAYLQLQAIAYFVLLLLTDSFSGSLRLLVQQLRDHMLCLCARYYQLIVEPFGANSTGSGTDDDTTRSQQSNSDEIELTALASNGLNVTKQQPSQREQSSQTEHSPLLPTRQLAVRQSTTATTTAAVSTAMASYQSFATAADSGVSKIRESEVDVELADNDAFVGHNLVRTLSSLSADSATDRERDNPRTRGKERASLVEIDHLYLSHPSAASHSFAIKDLSLRIMEGERVALVGINGGGKSSLFKHLAMGELLPTSGSTMLGRCDVVTDLYQICLRRLVGYVPQENGLIDYLTVRDYLQIAYHKQRSHFKALLSKGVIDKEFVLKYSHYSVHSLSGGNKKKLAVLLARIVAPKLLLLDECTSGVDPIAAKSIVRQLNPKLDATKECDREALLFTSHRIDECMDICERVVMLSGGRVCFDGPVSLFEALTTSFYQVDVYWCFPNPSLMASDGSKQLVKALLSAMQPYIVGTQQVQPIHAVVADRVVHYGVGLSRLTFAKTTAPLSVCWKALQQLVNDNIVSRFSFRNIDMEETFAILIANLKSQEPVKGKWR